MSVSGEARKRAVVLGGGGHVGLPLSLALAKAGLRVGILDIAEATLARLAGGEMPFIESGADELLAELGVPVTVVRDRPRRPLTLPALVAELRAVSADPHRSDAVRIAAAERRDLSAATF